MQPFLIVDLLDEMSYLPSGVGNVGFLGARELAAVVQMVDESSRLKRPLP